MVFQHHLPVCRLLQEYTIKRNDRVRWRLPIHIAMFHLLHSGLSSAQFCRAFLDRSGHAVPLSRPVSPLITSRQQRSRRRHAGALLFDHSAASAGANPCRPAPAIKRPLAPRKGHRFIGARPAPVSGPPIETRRRLTDELRRTSSPRRRRLRRALTDGTVARGRGRHWRSAPGGRGTVAGVPTGPERRSNQCGGRL